jgi:hypothetical protein
MAAINCCTRMPLMSPGSAQRPIGGRGVVKLQVMRVHEIEAQGLLRALAQLALLRERRIELSKSLRTRACARSSAFRRF